MSTPAPPRKAYIAAVIAVNSAAAIAYTLASKRVLKTLSLPLTLLWIQAVVMVCVLAVTSRLHPASGIQLHRPAKKWQAFLPLALTRILGALSKTACLANVDATFYQTARGLLLPFTVLLSLYFFPQTRFASLTLVGIALVILGFAGGIFVDLQHGLTLNWGIALGVWSSFTTAVETVVLKQYTAANDTPMLQLIYMSSLVAAIIYSPLILLFESEVWSNPSDKLSLFLSYAFVSSIFALILSFATWIQVKVTSPITHTICAASRGVLQSLLASFLFSEALPFHRIVGTALILGGTALYTYSKNVESTSSAGVYAPVPSEPSEKGRDGTKKAKDGPMSLDVRLNVDEGV